MPFRTVELVASAHRRDRFALGARVAIALEEGEFIDAAAHFIDLRQQAQTGNDEWFTREEAAARLLGLGHARLAGDIAGADVFFESEADHFGHNAASILPNCAS